MKKLENIKTVFRTVCLLILCALVFTPTTGFATTTVEKIVASVNNEAITSYELDREVKINGHLVQKQFGVSGPALRAKVLDTMINDKVLQYELKQSKLTVEPHEIDAFIERILRSSGMSMEMFLQQLSEKGMTLEEYKKKVQEQILKGKFVNSHVGKKINVTERELKDYFEKHMDEFIGASSVHLAQISILFTPETTQDDLKNIESIAFAVRSEAEGASNLAALAAKYNSSKFRIVSDDMGVVNISDLQPQIAQVASMLGVGHVSQPIPSSAGLHIIKMLERAKTSAKDFSSVREQVNNVVYDIKVGEALESFTKQLRKKAQVDIRGL